MVLIYSYASTGTLFAKVLLDGAAQKHPCCFPHRHTGFKELALPWYSDQILPFDITLCYTNEYGAAAAARLYGVEILNEGYGVSIDDAVSEMQATFVARGVSPMMAAGRTSLLM